MPGNQFGKHSYAKYASDLKYPNDSIAEHDIRINRIDEAR